MSELESFDRVVAAMQDAALGEADWSTASGLVDRLCGTKGNVLVHGDGDRTEDVAIDFAMFCHRGQRNRDSEHEYFSVYHPVDERMPRLRRLPDSKVVHCRALFTAEELRTSVIYNDVMVRGGYGDSLSVRLDGPDGSRIVWVAADPVDAEGWSSARTGTVGRFLPHIRQFVRVRHALAQAQALGGSLGAMLENSRLGIVQLDRRARIVAANDIALDLLRRQDGVCDEGGAFRALLPDDDARLQTLLAHAVPPFGGRGTAGSLALARPDGLSPLVLHVTPVADPEGDFRFRRAAALVLIVDARRRAFIDPDLVAATLGLTPAESEIAVSLAEGAAIGEIAASSGREEDAVRQHLKHISDRLGTVRQLELTQLVLSLAGAPKIRG